jgi:hypothetical protein
MSLLVFVVSLVKVILMVEEQHLREAVVWKRVAKFLYFLAGY